MLHNIHLYNRPVYAVSCIYVKYIIYVSCAHIDLNIKS